MSIADVARYWDDNADSWARQVEAGGDGFREHLNNPAFLRLIGNVRGKDVLDAGCGEGYNTRILAMKGTRVVGVDVSKKMIRIARAEEKKRPLGIRYIVGSMTDLSTLKPASFDAVLSFMALMDTPGYQDALHAFHRVLRAGGDLFFSVTHPCFTTKGYGWIDAADGSGLRLTVSDYFSDVPHVDRWRFKGAPKEIDPFTVPYFQRTMSDYLNRLVDAGFSVTRIEEPRPTKEVCRKNPFLERWRRHAAIFLHVHAVRR